MQSPPPLSHSFVLVTVVPRQPSRDGSDSFGLASLPDRESLSPLRVEKSSQELVGPRLVSSYSPP